MGKTTQLALLASQLLRLSNERNWPALAALDREVAAMLPLLSKQQQWRTEERLGFDELRRAHGLALRHCQRESARVDEGLTQLRARRQGWMAYALGNASEEEPT